MSPFVPAALAVLLLHQEAVRTGDVRLRIRESTLRQWVRRQHVTFDRGRGGYDVESIVAYVTKRPLRGQRRASELDATRQVDQVPDDVSLSRAAPPVCDDLKAS